MEQNERYVVGDEVTVQYEDEGETETLTGVITGFKSHSESGEQGFWLKYTVTVRGEARTAIAWWPLESIIGIEPHSQHL